MTRAEATDIMVNFRRVRGLSLQDVSRMLSMVDVEFYALERGWSRLKTDNGNNRREFLELGYSVELVEHLQDREPCDHDGELEGRCHWCTKWLGKSL